jgi:hypothetical protein
MRKKLSVVFAISTLLLVLCSDLNSPLDENSPNFVKPVITIDTAGSSLKPNDTLHFDSATLVLAGNRSECRFQVKVDGLSWSSWNPSGAFPVSSLSDGKHIAYINTMYSGGKKHFLILLSFL